MWCFIVLKYSLTLILYYEPYIMCKMKIIMLLKVKLLVSKYLKHIRYSIPFLSKYREVLNSVQFLMRNK